jgi:hypothetical protein
MARKPLTGAARTAHLEYLREYRKKNRAALAIKQAQYVKDHPDTRLNANLKKYGINADQYRAMLEHQEGRCAICKSKDTGSVRGWHVDHCHRTGKVRGLLCHPCNLLLGHAKDSIDTLQRCIVFLKENA